MHMSSSPYRSSQIYCLPENILCNIYATTKQIYTVINHPDSLFVIDGMFLFYFNESDGCALNNKLPYFTYLCCNLRTLKQDFYMAPLHNYMVVFSQRNEGP